MSFKRKAVGVIGLGQMGIGIAEACSFAGFDVCIKDIAPEQTALALTAINKNLKRKVDKGTISEADCRSAHERIRATSDYIEFGDCEFVIETATEDEKVKHTIFDALCPVLRPESIIATNTSTMSITHLASMTDRPEQFVGMHFMHPVDAMELVELVRGIATADVTFEKAKRFVSGLGKTAAEAADFPAFIVNRSLLCLINEAIYTLYEGVGSVDAIDTAMRLGAHHPMGPLQLADFVGLDTCLLGIQALHSGLSDAKYRPCPLLVKYVEAGWLGRKTGRGFYDYLGPRPIPTR